MSEPSESGRRVIKVPQQPVVEAESGSDRTIAGDDVPVNPADIGSASRSCLAIIIILVLIVLAICVFLLVQPMRA